MKERIIVAITGASGMVYARELLALLAAADLEVHGIISEAGEQVLGLELGLTPADFPQVRWWGIKQFTAPMASGSVRFQAMAVVPCTMGTLAAIAGGLSTNLIHRAADVMLKERRQVVLAVRETPFNRTHLQNMLAVHDAGAIICPAMPSMYQQPQSIAEMARTYAARVAETMGLSVDYPRWQGW
jgi:4-hydroxy-3-polyprenylbenzoate decarboxylase